jgi:hypothetical protein
MTASARSRLGVLKPESRTEEVILRFVVRAFAIFYMCLLLQIYKSFEHGLSFASLD